MSRLRALKRDLWHWLGWSTGEIVTWWASDCLMVGFKCSCCDEITHTGPVYGTQRRTVFPWGSFPEAE